MARIELKDIQGEAIGTVELADAVFGLHPNIPVMHQVVRAQQAAQRTGTHDTRTRGLVRGGGRKPYRQKGTGRARQGSIRSPQWRGGGVVFGPHPRSYAFKVNRKEIKLAMRSALSAKNSEGVLQVVDDFDFEKPSTKAAVAALSALGLSGRVTVVLPDNSVNAFLSFRNIPRVRVIAVSDSSTRDFLDNSALVFTSASLRRIEEVLTS
ncbi:MAG: 50S ribosomal protein L4 [Coriobacteriales bacterium]|jgi:large subunit ribosomal protein L4|nr:50S ribosomal protein L4 [Coriobacteriales bacterium]